eukprot:73979-Amphidinium_carterae.1
MDITPTADSNNHFVVLNSGCKCLQCSNCTCFLPLPWAGTDGTSTRSTAEGGKDELAVSPIMISALGTLQTNETLDDTGCPWIALDTACNIVGEPRMLAQPTSFANRKNGGVLILIRHSSGSCIKRSSFGKLPRPMGT